MSASLVTAALLAVVGCATVDPTADFERARDIIAERSGAGDVYDPESDQDIDSAVDRLLADGLSVDEAVSLTLLNNKELQALFQLIGASRADVVQSGLYSNPNLGLTVRFPEGGGRSDVIVGLAQQIVDVWQIPIRKRMAEAELEQVIMTVADRAISLAADTKQAYYHALAARHVEQLAGESRDLAGQLVTLAQARLMAGEIAQLDVNLVRAQQLSADIELLTVRRDREQAVHTLARVMGLSPDRIDSGLHQTWSSDPSEIADDRILLDQASNRRLDVSAAAQRVRAAQADLEREMRNVFPSVVVGLEGERMEKRSQPGRNIGADTARASIGAGQLTAPEIESRGQRNEAERQIIDTLVGPSLDIVLPVFDQNQAQIAKAAYKVSQLRLSLEDLFDEVAREVATAASRARTAQKLVHLYDAEVIPQAKMNLESARRGYEVGEQTVLTLIEAEKSLISQKRAQIEALRDLAQARAELEKAIGGKHPEEPTRPELGASGSEAKSEG